MWCYFLLLMDFLSCRNGMLFTPSIWGLTPTLVPQVLANLIMSTRRVRVQGPPLSLPWPWMLAMSPCLTPGTAPAAGSFSCQLPLFSPTWGVSALLPAPQASVSGAASPNPKARPLGLQCRACFCLFPCLRARSQTGSSRLAEACPSSLHLSRAGPLCSPFPFLGSI